MNRPPHTPAVRLRALFLALALSVPAAGAALPAHAASFGCLEAAGEDEATICKDCTLAQQDVKMATLYGVLTKLIGMGQRGVVQYEQQVWLRHRAECKTDRACLAKAYDTRIGQLEDALNNIYSRGPF